MIAIGTRRSPLAMWQAEFVRDQLRRLHPALEFGLVALSTRGDEQTAKPLAAIGDKGLFTQALDEALSRADIRLAVHSAKDVPTALPDFVRIGAILERHDPRDVLITRDGGTLDALPEGARLLTSSLRRRAQVLAARPDLRIDDIRGNVHTRLTRFHESQAHATILAKAGLDRMALDVSGRPMPPEAMTPAVGQGALLVTAHADDEPMMRLLRPLDHESTRRAVSFERAFLARLEGGCQAPIGAWARPVPDSREFELFAFVGSRDGSRVLRDHRFATLDDPLADADVLAAVFLAEGAATIVAQSRDHPTT